MDERTGGRVLGIGELLWDLFPDGPRLGGAPFNVVANVRRLGHAAAFVTAVGDDDLGRAAPAATERLGVGAAFISVARDLPPGTLEGATHPLGGHRVIIGPPPAHQTNRGPGAPPSRAPGGG